MLSLSFSSILRPRGGLSLASAVLLGLLVGQLVITVTEAEPEPRRRGGRGRGKVANLEKDLEEEAGMNREEKLLNIFQVVRFPNDACNTTAGDSGVCFTAAECTTRGGSNAGVCASGFGVCCSFSIGCGGETSQNNTYFSSSDNDVSPCTAKICRMNEDICQIRLDFDTFNIDQPAKVDLDLRFPVHSTQCINAHFTATSEGHTVPVLCGNNQGHHIYLEAEDSCNELAFDWVSTTGPKSWKIKTSQISCKDRYKAPEGCLQYYTGKTGQITSFNFAGGCHLANQRYFACIRTEQGHCQINWRHAENAFQLDGLADETDLTLQFGDQCTRDYVIIPHGRGEMRRDNSDRFCGVGLVALNSRPAIAATATTPAIDAGEPAFGTIRSQRAPFVLGVVFDGGEVITEDEVSKGFALDWEQMDDCTP